MTTSDQMAALRSLVPNLLKLEKLLAEERAAQVRALEHFAGDKRLQVLKGLLEDQRSEFDALEFIGRLGLYSGSDLWAREEFHSGVLAWLLHPKGTHGIGANFLKRFLARVGAQTAASYADWSGATVHPEWYSEVDGKLGYLDILVLNEEHQALCAIENKIFSGEHSEQLTRYRKALERRYSDREFSKLYVFLTPDGTEPYHEEERKHWTTMTYATVLDVLRQVIEDRENPVKEDVRVFLRQYMTTIRRNIVPETSLQQLARKIYLEHRDAIELINQYRPDFIAEAKPLFKEAINRQHGWTVTYEENRFFGFRPDSWRPYITIPDEYDLLRFQLDWRFDGNYPRLGLVIPPVSDTNREVREKLHQACLQQGNRFPGIQRRGDSWLWLVWTGPILGESDYSNWQDQAAIQAKIEAWFEKFTTELFPPMNDVIVNCLREHKAEQQAQ